MSTCWAVVRTTFTGTHCWPDVPAGWPHEYLKHEHRHLFHVEVKVQQYHDNRDVEFLFLLDRVIECCHGGKLDGKSCEMMCDFIAAQLRAGDYVGTERCLVVSVFEDGENGATVEYNEGEPL